MTTQAEPEKTSPATESEPIRYRPRGRILPARDVEAYETTVDFMNAARREAERLRADAMAVREAARRQGFEEGRQEGAEAASRKLAETTARADRYLAQADAEIVDLALAVVRQVLGQFEVGQLTRNAVRHALAKQRQDQHLTLYIAPDMVEEMQADLDGQIASGARHLLSVEPDPKLDRGQCRLASDMGFVDLGIENQLRAIHRGLRDGLDRQAQG